jgi:leucyl-tRNA synthetase
VEHAVLHLLYARFWHKVLFDLGYVSTTEPFRRLINPGIILGATFVPKDRRRDESGKPVAFLPPEVIETTGSGGETQWVVRDTRELVDIQWDRMSKSRGNVVNPDAYIEQWGADTFRTYLMFLGPFEEGGDFRDQGISGVRRFIERLWSSVRASTTEGETDPLVLRKLHQTIRKVGEDVPRLSYNTAIAAMMEYMNVLRRGERVPHRAEVEPVVQLVSPFAPHVAEELWEQLGHTESVFDSGWPSFDPALAAEETIELAVQVNGKLRGTLQVPPSITQDEAQKLALADPGIAKFVTGAPRKVVFVPGRLLNIVV